jgi:peptidoglycan LD-endopeptidase CwlK
VEEISEQRLALVNPNLAALVRAANDSLVNATGNGFRVAQGLRTYAEQAAIPKSNTNAGPGQSWHNFGLAVDCFPFLSGQAGALEMNDHTAPVFQAMVAVLQSEGLAWGGLWHSIKDYPHFQLAGIPVTPTDADRAAFASGGLQKVWSLYPASATPSTDDAPTSNG